MLRYTTALLLAAVAAIGLAQVQAGGAAKFGVGEASPVWANLPGVDGKKHSLADIKEDVVVVAITCNHCPVAVAYEDRLIEFTKKHAGKGSKVAVVAINVNNLEADKLDKMILRAKEKGFNFPYLHDETQKIGRDFNAKVTPEFYVLDKNRKVVYWGSFDDNQNEKKASKNYVEAAVLAALKGETPTVATTKAFGCGVK